jgi:integrase
MAVYKRKGTNKTEYWYVEISLPGGRKLKRSVGKVGQVTKTIARQYEHDLKKEIKLGRLDILESYIPTLQEFSIEYINHARDIKQKRSWNRDEQLLQPLLKLYKSKKLSEITTKDIEDFKLKRLKEVSAATVNRSLSVLRHLFNLAKRWKKFFGDNPVSIVGLLEENNQVERILTPKEEKTLIEASISYLRPVIITALNTGMRKAEILDLKWSDIDLSNSYIIINQTNSKSKKQRKIPVNSFLKKLLIELKLKSLQSEYVYLDNKGQKINTIRTAFTAACRRANLKGLRFHDLRHTAATRMVESGANIVAISKILGHSDIKTTMRYTHPEDSLKEALESLGNFGNNTTKIATN